MIEKERIYLDNNSTTPIDPKALDAMMYDYGLTPRNASSIHSFGREARNELTKARRAISKVLKAHPDEIIFSSGATESNNFILKGFFKEIFPKKIISSKIEHSSVFKLIENYRNEGGEVHYIEVGEEGFVSIDKVKEALDGQTALIALMAVNNETGVKTDYKKIAELAYEQNIPYFIDGVALLGKEPFEVVPGISAMTFSGHKLHAPKGIGFAYLEASYNLPPLIEGGAQEHGVRAGTQNLAGILGLGKAIEQLPSLLPDKTKQMDELRNHFEKSLQAELSDVVVNGTGPRVCNTSNLSFLGLDGESLLMNLDIEGIAASHGSACSSGSLQPSRILTEMGLSKDQIASAIRFSISRMTTQNEINQAIERISNVVKKMR